MEYHFANLATFQIKPLSESIVPVRRAVCVAQGYAAYVEHFKRVTYEVSF